MFTAFARLARVLREPHPRCREWGTALCVLVLALAPSQAAVIRPEEPGGVEKIVTTRVVNLLKRHHYGQRGLDDALSQDLFDEYFERLDSNRSFFLASDLEDLLTYRDLLDDFLPRGKIEFAYVVYNLFVERARGRLEYVKERLKQPFDFNADEELLLDRSEKPWCATREELDEVWRKRVKNSLLVYELMGTTEEQGGTDIDGKPETEATTPIPKDPPPPAEAQPPKGPATDGGTKDGAEATGTGALGTRLAQRSNLEPKDRVLKYYERYLTQLESKGSLEIAEIFLTSLARLFDPHSSYMAPQTEEDFDIDMSLSLKGIGAVLTTEDGLVKVVRIIKGGPADRDERLKSGDRILAVAQGKAEAENVIDQPLRKVVSRIRGEKGTVVALTVLEAGKALGSVPVVIDITRDEVQLTDQGAKLDIHLLDLPPAGTTEGTESSRTKVAVISLPSFYADFGARAKGAKDYNSSTRDVRKLLEDAGEQNATGIILDLRGNTGGSLDEAISLSGLFFGKGPVVQVRHTNGRVKKRRDPDDGTTYGGPLVVLVDRLSASATEILAACLQDYRRAIIVGEGATHGKGTVQIVYHLESPRNPLDLFKDAKLGSLKFTTAKFYRVNGGSTQGKGVTPDIEFPSYTDHMELGESHLPRALPWDTIDALEFSSPTDISSLIPILRDRSAMRVTRDEAYGEMLKDIAKYGERRARKTLSLKKTERLTLQKEEKAWSEKLRKLMSKRASREEAEGPADGEDNVQFRDFILEEAFAILADTILLQGGRELPAASPVTVTKAAPATETVGANKAVPQVEVP